MRTKEQSQEKQLSNFNKKLKYLIKITTNKKIQKHSNPTEYILNQLSKQWPFPNTLFKTLNSNSSKENSIEIIKELLHKDFFQFLQKINTENNPKLLEVISQLTINMQIFIQQIEHVKQIIHYIATPTLTPTKKKELNKAEHTITLAWKNLLHTPIKLWNSTHSINKKIIEIHDFTIMLSYELKKLLECSKIELLEDELNTGSIAIKTNSLYIHTTHTHAQQIVLKLYKDNYPKLINQLTTKLYEQSYHKNSESSFFKKQKKILEKDLYQVSQLFTHIKPFVNTLETALNNKELHKKIQSIYYTINLLKIEIKEFNIKQTQYPPPQLKKLSEQLENNCNKLLEKINELKPLFIKNNDHSLIDTYDLHYKFLKKNTKELIRELELFKEIYCNDCQMMEFIVRFSEHLLSSEEKYQLMFSLKKILRKNISINDLVEKLTDQIATIKTKISSILNNTSKEFAPLLENVFFLHKNTLVIIDHLQENELHLKHKLQELITTLETEAHLILQKIIYTFLITANWYISPKKWKQYKNQFSSFTTVIYTHYIQEELEALLIHKSAKKKDAFIYNYKKLIKEIPDLKIPKTKKIFFKTKWGKLYSS